jgi:hypothetical protein
MSSQIIKADDLVSQVRSLLDEDNRESVSDTVDILPALNRAMNYASNILARHYESPMLKKINVTTVSGQKEYNIPEDAFEERLEKVEVEVNKLFYPVQRISYRDISLYESQSATSIPYYYVIVNNRYRIIPNSNAAYPLRIWYLVDPLPLVLSQGRINTVNTTDNYIVVDAAGSDLTTESDQLDSYVNIIDAQSGTRKATLQVKTISGNRITFKTVPARTTVLNTTIDTSLATDSLSVNTDINNDGPDVVIEPDDFVCLIHGSCVPFFKKPFSNFLIQYAIAEIRRKLGGAAELEQRVLKELEEQVERSWVGRENSLRVSKKSAQWETPVRRRYGGNS